MHQAGSIHIFRGRPVTDEQRITELEIRFSHQDMFIQELNEIVVSQQKKIEMLEKAILDLKRTAMPDDGVTKLQGMKEDKPPHY